MNEFKIISIEEFDADFVQNIRVKKSQVKSAPQSLIPEMIKPEAKPIEDEQIFVPAKKEEDIVIYPSEDEKQPKFFNRPSAEITDNEEDFSAPLPVEKPKKKTSKSGILAGKIISIIMICITSVTFLLGCFTSIFLNNGSDIGGVRFNTQLRTIAVGDDTIKEGALIISKDITPDEYSSNLNKPVAVPVEGRANEGCDIMYIYSAKYVTADNASVEVYDPISNQISSRVYSHNELLGIVTHYIPFVGLLLNFALSNAILVCALFILLTAFWCLLLVLMIKKRNK